MHPSTPWVSVLLYISDSKVMKKKNITYIVLFILFIIVLIFPTVQMKYKIFKLKPLKGSTNPVEVKFDFENYKNNTFQAQVNDYLRYNLGFRELLIRFYNQYSWDFYKKVENKTVFFGKENWLFFYDHLLDHYESITYKYAGSCEEMESIFERDARLTYCLQEILKEYGVTLFVGIAPSKDQLYSEFLPENTQFGRKPCYTAYDFYERRLDEIGVNCIDINAIFKKMKDSVDYPLFYKSSSHYSLVSAAYQIDTLIRYMENISGLNMINIEYSKPKIGEVQDIDKDMENLFNLLRPIERTDYYYVDIKSIPDSNAYKPRWLTVGDSFFWNLINQIPQNEIFSHTPYWYYNKEVYFDPGHRYTDEVDMLTELISSDFVMLYWCPINMYDLEHNFLIRAIESLCFEDDTNYFDKDKLIEYIKTDEKWYNSIVEQAENNGVSVDEMLSRNTEYTIEMRRKERLDIILGDSIPTCRNSRIQKILENKK